MNKFEFSLNKKNKLSCDMSYNNKKRTLFKYKTIELLKELERSLEPDEYDISVIRNTVTLNCDDAIIQFNNYDDLKDILMDYMPSITNDIDTEVFRYRRHRVVGAKRAGLKTTFLLAATIVGIMNINMKIANDITVTKSPTISIEKLATTLETVKMDSVEGLKVSKNNENLEELVEDIEEAVSDLSTTYYNIDINCGEHSEDYDIVQIQNKYREYAEKIGAKWGVSPNLILAMLTQETHGLETNLMQINFDSKRDEIYTVYNFETNEYCSYVLTDNPRQYDSSITVITREDLTNPFTNISVATIYYRSVLNKYANNNPIAAIELYNKGPGNFNEIIDTTMNKTGLTRDQILSDVENPVFVDYSYVCDAGDPNYVPNVLQYLNCDMIVTFVDENGEISEVKCIINKTKKEELSR